MGSLRTALKSACAKLLSRKLRATRPAVEVRRARRARLRAQCARASSHAVQSCCWSARSIRAHLVVGSVGWSRRD